MVIIMFAMIGTKLSFGAGYWIIFGIYCCLRVAETIYQAIKDN